MDKIKRRTFLMRTTDKWCIYGSPILLLLLLCVWHQVWVHFPNAFVTLLTVTIIAAAIYFVGLFLALCWWVGEWVLFTYRKQRAISS